jgi:hypothetical protein
MTFNIGQQNASLINNTAGNQYVQGGQQGAVVAGPEVLEALARLRSALPALPLPAAAALAAEQQLLEAEEATHGPHADHSRAASALERLTRILARSGALAAAAGTLVEPLRTLSQWLGPLGQNLLRMIPGL